MEVLYTFWVVLACCGCVIGVNEILVNPGFESGISYWKHDGFNMQTDSTHVHGGVASVKCTGRTRTYQGPSQEVNIKPGGRYSFSAFIQLIDDLNGHPEQSAMVKILFIWKDDGSKTYFSITARRHLTAAMGWIVLGAEFIAPNREYTQAKLYFEGLDPGVEFYLDDTSLVEVPEDTAWESSANQRIESLRKSNIHFKFDVDSGFDVQDIQVQIDHTRHLFGFGSMVPSKRMVDPDFEQYQKIVYHMFNWATIQDYKWKYNRGNRTHPDYNDAVAATDLLLKHGLHVRGHCMFWAVPGHEPSYVTPMTGSTLKNEVDEHIKYMTNITKGKLSHWDVNNELLHGKFFEDGTGDPNYSKHMFQAVHNADPAPKLFLNDYNVVASGQYTRGYLSQILDFKAANVSLGGVGVQSHFKGFQEPDATMIKYRLDMVAKGGVPIWVTELDLYANDEDSKADWYEKVLRVYFSHPSVQGVIFWGFWDHDMDPLKALVHGYTYKLDKAGERFLHLTKEEWSTHVNISLSSGTTYDLRGFQGNYDMVVWYKGKPIKHRTFFLGKTDKTLTIQINGDGQEIMLPVKEDPFATRVETDHETTSQNLRTLGHASSTSQSQQLECTTRWSTISAAGDDKTADIQCENDEVLTSCSSFLKNNDWHKDGEQMVKKNGVPTCRAVNGHDTTEGVGAIARCCKLKDLSCTYKTAGPSGTGIDDQVEVPCSNQNYPLGCSTWTYATHSDGTYFTNNSCIGQNDDPKVGVHSYASCCNAPNLQCSTVYSKPGGQGVGDKATAQCPSGQVMTGCNVFSKYGRAAGAYMAKDVRGSESCIAVNGFKKYGDEIGVQAIATCCHT